MPHLFATLTIKSLSGQDPAVTGETSGAFPANAPYPPAPMRIGLTDATPPSTAF